MVAMILLALAAQDTTLFEQAPPHIDEALRGRITQFYQAHVDGRFTRANAVVAEESKDVFLEAEKRRCRTFMIQKLTYSDEFTKAKAVVTCEIDILLGARRVWIPAPMGTNWKVVGGQWFWYHIPVDPEVGRLTPFGVMKGGAGEGDALPDPLSLGPSPADVLSAVKADKTEVMLSSFEAGSAEVILAVARGRAKLSLEKTAIPGLEMSLEKEDLRAGESTRLRFRYTPPDKSPKSTQIVRVTVFPTGQIVPITLKFAVPPEVQKLIPRVN